MVPVAGGAEEIIVGMPAGIEAVGAEGLVFGAVVVVELEEER